MSTPAIQLAESPLDETKYDVPIQDERNTAPKDGADELVVAASAERSAYEHLGTWRAIRKFKRAFAIGVAASFVST